MSLSLILMAGCGGGEESKPAADKSIKIGMLKYLNASETEFDGFMAKISEAFALDMSKHSAVYFDNLSAMQMALEAGKIEEMSTYVCVANYLAARNPNIEVLDGHTLEFIDAFCLALRDDEPDLRAELDAAISEMNADGTLANITKIYITDVTGNVDPPAVDFETFDGADTIKVAITGDLPVLDLIRTDGKPAGFNTAVLSEIG